MELKGSQTEKNLMEAFAGESQARNKYTYFASQAKKDGYVQVGEIFQETADNEKEHAKIWFKILNGGAVPATLENLKAAAAGENDEWTRMYPEFAEVAKKEGFEPIAYVFEEVAQIEKAHEERYKVLAEKVGNEAVFTRPEVVVWQCANCGHLHVGEKAPDVCPVCDHPQSYFHLVAENYK